MSLVVFASAIYKILIKTQCLKNNLNFRIKTEPVTAGADASVSICPVSVKTRHIPLHLLQL